MHLSAPLLLALLPDHASIKDLIGYQLSGLIVVFVALGSIWVLLEIVGAFFKNRQSAPAAASIAVPVAAAAPAAAPAPEVGLPPAIVAAIAAAVHVAVGGRPHRIASINPAPTAAAWAAEGRRDIFSSHRLR
jgi:hypothetical protein